MHRIGRTGRAGASGKAVSFCDVEERMYLRDIQKLIAMQIPIENDHPFPAENHIPDAMPKSKPQSQGRSQSSYSRPSAVASTGSSRSSSSDSNRKGTGSKNIFKQWYYLLH